MEIGLFCMLGICSLEDLWKRQLHIWIIAAFVVVGIAIQLVQGKLNWWQIGSGVLVGVFLWVCSCLSQEKIGKGDAVLLMGTGVYLGFWNNLILLWLASLGAALVGAFAHFILKKKKDVTLPFAPFLLLAGVFMKLLNIRSGL